MIYFYPHSYLRDRQIDTVRCWPASDVSNPQVADRKGDQVSAAYANSDKLGVSLIQRLPLLNIKMRPADVPTNATVYIWGGLVATGKFIVDLDNPWSLVGYNLRAMGLYRRLIRKILLSSRCAEIRCMSEACRRSLLALFGNDVFEKSRVFYPRMPQVFTAADLPASTSEKCRFLFVGTQFEIKGGEALLKAFGRVSSRHQNCQLDMITHLPSGFVEVVEACPGVVQHEPGFNRDQIYSQFMRNADVLILPTYVESFGMVVLEALAHGMAVIATDVYAIGEMVEDGINGHLLEPPVCIWNGVVPSEAYYDLANIKSRIRSTDITLFVSRLESAIEHFVVDSQWRLDARRASVRLMARRFEC